MTLVSGIQHWAVPFTGTYQITAVGASGGYVNTGTAVRGRGAYMRGDFDLTKGEVIKILVGQQGTENKNIWMKFNIWYLRCLSYYRTISKIEKLF